MMVIEHRLCSDDPALARLFAGLGTPAAPVPEGRRAALVPHLGWVVAGVLWAVCVGSLVVGGVFGLSAAVLAGMLLLPVALWVSLSQPPPERLRMRLGRRADARVAGRR